MHACVWSLDHHCFRQWLVTNSASITRTIVDFMSIGTKPQGNSTQNTGVFFQEIAVHYCDVIMGTMASLITSLTSVYSTVHWGADQRKHQSSASLAFVRRSHRWPPNSPHKWPITRKMFPVDDVIMWKCYLPNAGHFGSGLTASNKQFLPWNILKKI